MYMNCIILKNCGNLKYLKKKILISYCHSQGHRLLCFFEQRDLDSSVRQAGSFQEYLHCKHFELNRLA